MKELGVPVDEITLIDNFISDMTCDLCATTACLLRHEKNLALETCCKMMHAKETVLKKLGILAWEQTDVIGKAGVSETVSNPAGSPVTEKDMFWKEEVRVFSPKLFVQISSKIPNEVNEEINQ